MIAETLAGISLLKASVDFIKSHDDDRANEQRRKVVQPKAALKKNGAANQTRRGIEREKQKNHCGGKQSQRLIPRAESIR